MAGKSKKRKAQKHSTGQQPAKTEQPREEQAVSAAAVAAPPAKETKKAARPAKATPVTTKKPSRLRFFPEAVNELRRAHWPSRREAIRLSLMVAAVCIVVGAALGAVDFAFTRLVAALLLGS